MFLGEQQIENTFELLAAFIIIIAQNLKIATEHNSIKSCDCFVAYLLGFVMEKCYSHIWTQKELVIRSTSNLIEELIELIELLRFFARLEFSWSRQGFIHEPPFGKAGPPFGRSTIWTSIKDTVA
jgi:hypothetical protein